MKPNFNVLPLSLLCYPVFSLIILLITYFMANKGCQTLALNLLVFTEIMGTAIDSGIATHWLTTIPSSKL